MVDERIQWSHSPAHSPHFGGMWEAGVKQMKALLYKTLGTQMLTCEEMNSILIEVEAVLNSRPLIPMDSAPVDGAQVLTPGHFLVGHSLKALPELPDTASKITVLRRWNLCKRLSHGVWTKWSQDYLHLLQIQYHHFLPQRSIQVGDIVLLKDPELFDRSWPLAIVRAVHRGQDGLVRVVTLDTQKGTYERAVNRLVPLIRVPASLGREDDQA